MPVFKTMGSADKPVAQFMNEAAQLKAKVDVERGKPVNGGVIDGSEEDCP